MQATMIQKQDIIHSLDTLPEQTFVEEAMERLFILSKIEKGCQDADTGKIVTHSEAKERLKKWLS